MANRNIAHAVRVALVTAGAVSAGLYGVTSFAQEQLDEVVITGTRIAKRDAVAESPIMTLDNAAMKDSGYVTVDQFLNTLPQVVPAVSSQSNNPSSNGRAFIDLRGLGSNRNLVLIDGRRGMGSTSGGVVDVNTIPAALVDRVEVISGGAAATYGPDAVAGVVNFIMKKDFDGFAIDSTYRLTEQSDGEELGFDLTFGEKFADGRGSAVFNAGYFKREAIYKGARDFSAQASSRTGTFPGGGWSPGTNQPSLAAVNTAFGTGLCPTSGGTSGFAFNPDGSLFCTGLIGNSAFNVVNYTGPANYPATLWYPDTFSYNFEPDNILVLPMERWSLYSHFELDLGTHFKPYAKAIFTNYNALQELAATPAAGSTGFTVPVTNPFIPAQLATLLASRTTPGSAFSFSKRFNDLGGRTGYNTHDVWQLVAGTKGEIAGSWNYDLYASYGRSVQNEVQGGNVRRDRVQALLDAPTGAIAGSCDAGLNLFGASPISQQCKDYISLEAKNLTTVEQLIVEAVVTGDLFELPAGVVQSAFGASYRDIDYNFQPDGGLQPGLVAGFNQQLPTSGQLDYTDVFMEVSVPILADMTAVKKLSLTLGARTTDNNISGDDQTWKATLDWSINDYVRFRGGAQHAVRSPNISELFAPQLNNFPTAGNSDPCNTTTPPGTGAILLYRNGPNDAQVQALCAAQSAVAGAAGFNQPFGQFTAIVGGNPNLKPETADSWTAGFVVSSPWESPMLERLSFSIDYFKIELEDVITSLSAVTIVQRCYNRDGANPTYSITNSYCQLFNREPSNGGVIDLQQLAQNQAFISADGVDATINWGFGLDQIGLPASAGDLNFTWITSWTGSWESQTTTVDPVYDFAGSIGQTTGSSTPEWKATIATTWSRENLQVQLTSRFIDAMIHGNVVTGSAATPTANTPVPSTWYFDLSGRYDITENLSVRLSVNNIADQQPRLYTPNVQANTDPSLYDVLGRRYFLGLNWRM